MNEITVAAKKTNETVSSSAVNTYKTQQVMTASPQELTMMLYNGAVRFANESIQAIEAGDLQKAHNSNMYAQDIIRELMCTLDMKYDISKNLRALYDYIEYRLIEGNLKKDKEQVIEARNLIAELRDAWYQAMKSLRVPQAAAR